MVWSYENIAPLLWVAYFLISALGTARPRRIVVPPPPAAGAPRIVVLVPVRGIGPATRRFFELLMAQDYPNFRVLLLVESAADPAVELLRVPGMERRARLVVAGEATASSQKVHNLLAGVEGIEPEDRVVVLCDADSILPANWLTQLTQPLRDGEAEVTTTFRMLIPRRRQLSLCLYAYADVSLALSARPPFTFYCWGGSTAVLADRLPRLDLPRFWQGAYSDDLAFSEAVRKARLKGKLMRHLLLPSDFDMSAAAVARFSRRQFFVLTQHMPLIALGAGLVPALPFLFWTSAIVRTVEGSVVAPYAMVAVFLLDALRAWLRYDGVRRVAGEEAARRFRCAALAGWALSVPLGPVAIVSVLRTFLMREVTWAGIRYRLRGPRKVEVLEREPPGRTD